MKHKKAINLVILSVVISLLACGVENLPFVRVRPTSTPTIVLARFTTATPTPLPSDTPVVEPTATPTATPEATVTLEATKIPQDAAPPTDEAAATEVSPTEDETVPESPTETPTPAETPTVPPPPPTATPTETPLPTPAPLSGRIAFSIDDGGGHNDVWVIELPDGEPFLVQARARQPNFSKDGRLLVNNHDNQYGESLGVIDTNYAWLGIINNSPYDAYPFWHPDGNRYVYSNPQLLLDPITNDPLMHVFIPCSMKMPSLEEDIKCQDIRTYGKVAIGEAPVWTDDDRIAFFTFEGDDGIYTIKGASTLWESGDVGPKQLLVKCNGRPTDTDGFQVFFSAGDIDGNWEAYSIDLDGSNLTNLSNAPFFQDGLPTVSPDGNWVAFVSDRDGVWGIWLVPRHGGEPAKVVDLSKINTNPSPWGVGDQAWQTERMSWGP